MASEGQSLVVFECGPACRCGAECSNRVTQRGIAARVKVVRHRQKGWCLHAAEDIRRGAFVCQYAGELLTNAEANRRHLIYDCPEYHSSGRPPPALLVVREHLPSKTASLRLNIDATHFGNVARFVNHSCDGGNATRVLVRQTGWPLPHVALFANREILAGEEITMSYGEVKADESTLQTAPPCYCGSSNCIGLMPRDVA
ncbi:Putative histone H3 (Lys9) methyltransferase [Klebsormidium nitens]|uniref:Putative histone H3 (Lys9) methyltransferase n=1 Tax=Klebsormidium nitens TaxID=105231 RepID=A0A1Y1HIZ6_KLENI|nr:Putative histone H3 (Lys9) methyltransferase [Klebsormidium nitens]|eukprot:GAQ77873.1 Putative histone H3 (Lys9) methyltransferase [Klebsormidium nitens]